MSQLLSHPLALAWSLPWLILPLVTTLRLSRSKRLDAESATAPEGAPFVSVIVPARNERRNISECLSAVLASTYPSFEVIVVDDHSSDGTSHIARAIDDSRLMVLSNPDLPAGWFGKQWACWNGALQARGEIFVFLDADARMAPSLLTRSVNGMLRARAELYSVLGSQTMVTFWERMIQPQIFSMLASRYGGTEAVNRSSRAHDKIANGQYLMMLRSTYEELRGHELVREYVAEDLMLAQKVFASGRKTVIVAGFDELTTRMYTSLRELIDGWGKNVYAGGRDAMPFGRAGRLIFPLVLPLPAIGELAPILVLVAAVFGFVSVGVAIWGATATLFLLIWWMLVYRINKLSIAYAFCFPLGAAVMLYIMVRATLRGNRVAWKGRDYVIAVRKAAGML